MLSHLSFSHKAVLVTFSLETDKVQSTVQCAQSPRRSKARRITLVLLQKQYTLERHTHSQRHTHCLTPLGTCETLVSTRARFRAKHERSSAAPPHGHARSLLKYLQREATVCNRLLLGGLLKKLRGSGSSIRPLTRSRPRTS